MVDVIGTAEKDTELANAQIADERAARLLAHQEIIDKYNAMTSKAKGTYSKSHGRGKPVPGGWEKKGKFTPLN